MDKKEKEDMEFELRWVTGNMDHNPENCQMCGYCTGEIGFFSFDCMRED